MRIRTLMLAVLAAALAAWALRSEGMPLVLAGLVLGTLGAILPGLALLGALMALGGLGFGLFKLAGWLGGWVRRAASWPDDRPGVPRDGSR